MEILPVINKILGLKIVQWCLLTFFVAATIFMVVQTGRLKLAHIEITSLQADNLKKDGLVVEQNASIANWKREGELAKAKVKAATEAAAKAALEYDAKLAALRSKPIREDCCGAIEDAKNIILGVK